MTYPASDQPRVPRRPRRAGRSCGVVVAPLALLGCPRPAPVEPTGGDEPQLDAAPAADETALERAIRMIDAAQLEGLSSTRETDLARAAAAGLTVAEIVRLLEELLADCLATAATCEDFSVSGGMFDRPDRVATEMLFRLLGEAGSTDELPFLARLDSRFVWRSGLALERILERRWIEARPLHPPTPPTATDVAAVRTSLDDFAALRVRDGTLVAEAPTAAELDDLAYFLAAVRDAAPEVGTAQEAGRGSFARPGAPDAAREALARDLDAAKYAGDLPAVIRSGLAYLESLGYPGPIRTDEESSYAWGGASWSYVMRDVARAAEATGDFALAEALYRRAPPGGGACGTSVDARWREQVEGAIRTAELAGHPNAAVAERLLAVDGAAAAWNKPTYGPLELAEAGFDLARLYRGALLAVNREAPIEELQSAFGAAPPDLGPAARRRLDDHGAEDWERRVWAVEGLADVAGRDALPTLFGLLDTGRTPVRVRALRALGAAAERPHGDPCRPIGFGFGEGGSTWEREITPFGHDCETVITLAETDELAARLHPFLGDPEPDVRAAAAAALGRIASPTSRARLQHLANHDPGAPDAGEVCRMVTDETGATHDECTPYQPVREAALEAIEWLDRVEQAWARQAAEATEATEATGPIAPP